MNTFQLSWESARINPSCRFLWLVSTRAPSSMQLDLAIIYPPTLTRVLLAQSKQPYLVCASWCRGFRCPFRGIWGSKHGNMKKAGFSAGVSILSLNPFGMLPPGCTPTPGSPSGLGSLAFLFPLSSFAQWLNLFWRSHFTSSMSNGSYLKPLQPPFCSGSLMDLRNNETPSSESRYPQ